LKGILKLKVKMKNEILNDDFSDEITRLFLIKAETKQNTIDYRMMLAAKISFAVKNKGWNKKEFAKKMDIKNLSIITKWLSGTNNFETDTLYKIQTVLNISLLNIEEDKSKKDMTVNIFFGAIKTIQGELKSILFQDYKPTENIYNN